jgi:hypothetical protein
MARDPVPTNERGHMRRAGSLKRAGLALVLILPVAGCGDDEARDDDVSGTRDAAPTVELLDAGAKPRTALRLDLEEGDRASTSITTQQTVDSGVPVEVPRFTMSFTTEVLNTRDSEFDTEVVFGPGRVSDSDADPVLVAELKRMIDTMEGVTGRAVQSTRGELHEIDFDLPDDLPDAMAAVMDQFLDQSAGALVPLPVEEVGLGARWTATTNLEVNGTELEQVATYTLDALDGPAYEVSVEIEQEFQPGEADGFELTSGTGSATGRMSGRTDSLAPAASTVESTSTITGEAQDQSVEVRTTSEMRLRTVP